MHMHTKANTQKYSVLGMITKTFHSQWKRYEIKEGIMYRRWWDEGETGKGKQIVLPVQYREEAIKSAHASISGGHMGVRKTQDKVAMMAYWVGWQRDVREYCLKCDACARYHRGLSRKERNCNTCVLALPGNG